MLVFSRVLLRRLAVLCFLAAVASSCTSNSFAVIDAHSQTNTVPPADGVPWDNVGSHNGSTGVYLGERWVLSAHHVGAGDIMLLGIQYSWDGISYRLTNSNGSLADLELFHLSASPPLTNLVLASSAPSLNTGAEVIGCGRISAGPTNIGGLSGFAWGAYTGIKSWGNNKVSGLTSSQTVALYDGNATTTCFPTTFDQVSQTAHESQVAAQDSGGGTFTASGSSWQLSGINLYTSRSDPAAIYGDTSLFGNIATYRTQIINLMTTGARPFLTIVTNGSNVQITWPMAASGYRLQAASSPTGAWTPLTGTIATSGVTNLPATNTIRLFRLSKP